MASPARRMVEQLLEPGGIVLNGPHPWDPQIHDERVFDRILRDGPIGIGESYMDAWWSAEDVAELIYRALRFSDGGAIYRFGLLRIALEWFRVHLLNLQSVSRAWHVGEHHYDIGNDLYVRMLDKRLTYSCGYWKNARTLDEAQDHKLDLICRKIGLKKGDRVLDIGCGWGSFAFFAAEKYGASVVGITISKEQLEYAQAKAGHLPVEFRMQDYRTLDNEKFDHVVSVGMFEHVGHKNYRTYLQKVLSLLKKDGLFLLHTIGDMETREVPDPWLDKYIFPNGFLPSAAQITEAANGLFVLEDWHNFGADYDKTLMAWYSNFKRSWPELREKYGERFYRMWEYYLTSCAGAFRARNTELWQIVLSRRGVLGGYQSIR